jgi:glycogen operon protein
MRNAIAMLMVCQGVPMILMGDEMAHTKLGNNNTYAQDNELSWLNWRRLEEHAGLFNFFKQCIAFRKVHPDLRRRCHLHERDLIDSGFPDISWHGVREYQPDWSPQSRTLAFMLCGMHAALLPGHTADDYIYVAVNMHWEPHTFTLPRLRDAQRWHRFADTFRESPDDVVAPGKERPLRAQRNLFVGPRSVVILVGRR